MYSYEGWGPVLAFRDVPSVPFVGRELSFGKRTMPNRECHGGDGLVGHGGLC